METTQRHSLRLNHVSLVDELNPRDVMDDLYEDGILTESDCDRITAANTRKEQCRLLLALLPTRGPSAYVSFFKSLKMDYSHLACLLRCSMRDINNGRIQQSQVEHGKIPSICKCIETDHSRTYIETGLSGDASNVSCVKACSKCSPFIPKFAVPSLEAVIKQKCCLILGNVEANDLLDLHYQEFVLGGEECERIKSGKTRSERCIIFISELSQCTCSQVTSVFARSLQKKYGYIINELKTTKHVVTGNVLSQPIVDDIQQPIVDDIPQPTVADIPQPIIADIPQPFVADIPQPIVADIPRPILKNVLRMGMRAHMEYPMKQSFSVNVPFNQPQPLHSKVNQLEDEFASSADYEYALANDVDHPLPKHQTSRFGRFQFPTQESLSNNTDFSQESLEAFEKEDAEWMIRRNRHLKQKRKLFDKRSRHVFSGNEDNISDNGLHFFCPAELVNEPNPNVDHRKQPFGRDWREETGGTHSSFVDGFDSASCRRRKRAKIHKVSEQQPSTSGSFRTNSSSRKKTENIQRNDKSSEYVYSITKTNTSSECCRRKVVSNQKQQSKSEKCRALSNISNLLALAINLGSITPQRRTRRLEALFNDLSTMINQGHFQKFERFAMNIQLKFGHDSDMMCILDYLHASRDLSVTDVDAAKKHINTGLQRVAKTNNPKYSTLELFAAQTRMYLTKRKLQKFANTLADAKMIIATDPVGCSGRAAGWLYMNDVRSISGQLAILNVHRPNYHVIYKHLRGKAMDSCQKALDHFHRDSGNDGPVGIVFAFCRLAMLLLRCGDNGLTMDLQQPDTDDIEIAENYLRQLENSNIVIPKVLEVYHLLAKCDLQYRRTNSVRALEHAEEAYRLATNINLLESTAHAHNRVVFLRTMPVFIKGVDEVEVSKKLLDDSADSC